jgi:hypothetical protein
MFCLDFCTKDKENLPFLTQ